eukprot:3871555-Pyramimonas_sp.AAC.1
MESESPRPRGHDPFQKIAVPVPSATSHFQAIFCPARASKTNELRARDAQRARCTTSCAFHGTRATQSNRDARLSM